MPIAPLTTKDMQDTGNAMAHSYNTRLRKSRDGKSDEELLPDPGEITGFFQHLYVDYENKSGNKKAKKEPEAKSSSDADMELTNELISDTEISSLDSQQPRVSRRVKKLQKYKFEDRFYWKAISWLKDANTKHPIVRDGRYVSVKDIVRVGTEYFSWA